MDWRCDVIFSCRFSYIVDAKLCLFFIFDISCFKEYGRTTQNLIVSVPLYYTSSLISSTSKMTVAIIFHTMVFIIDVREILWTSSLG